MQLTRDMDSLQEALAPLARAGKRVALVPTMGALHEGHMSLIRRARQEADAVAVSIFVNPKQFGQNEDFSKYPRMLDSDLQKCEKNGASLVYAPAPEDIYPDGFTTSISVGALGAFLEGKSRPGHFDGVATIVAKLLLRVMPSIAIFGEKDYQQLCVINRLVDDLDIPVTILAAPTLREPDGLAMSSRNAYLSPHERAVAPMLYEVLIHVASAIENGSAVPSALAEGVAALTKSGFKVDYLELREEDTLAPLERLESPARLLAAAWLGTTRLIDNIELSS